MLSNIRPISGGRPNRCAAQPALKSPRQALARVARRVPCLPRRSHPPSRKSNPTGSPGPARVHRTASLVRAHAERLSQNQGRPAHAAARPRASNGGEPPRPSPRARPSGPIAPGSTGGKNGRRAALVFRLCALAAVFSQARHFSERPQHSRTGVAEIFEALHFSAIRNVER